MRHLAFVIALAFCASPIFAQGLNPGVPTSTTGTNPMGIACGDFDGDGVNEVIVACNGTDQIELFENDGVGNLSSVGLIAMPGGATGASFVDTGDINGVGFDDLVVSCRGPGGAGGDGIAVFVNTSPAGGPISFAADLFYAIAPSTMIDPWKIVVDDLDGANGDDVAVSTFDLSGATLSVAVYPSLSTASPFYGGAVDFGPMPGPGTQVPDGIDADDLDGDGDIDLLVGHFDVAGAVVGGVSIFTNDGAGIFTPAPGAPFAPSAGRDGPDTVHIMNLNGAGQLDCVGLGIEFPFAVCNDQFDAWINNPALTLAPVAGGPWGATQPTCFIACSICDLDLDQDGDFDAVCTFPTANVIGIYMNDGPGTFTTTSTLPAGTLPQGIDCCDLNGDGLEDVIVASGSTNEIILFTQIPAPLVITTACPLPGGTVGTPYTTTLTGTGGVPPYAWTILPGVLPPGLALNPLTGVISGTPTTAGLFAFTINLTDSLATTVSLACSITVAAAPPPPPPPPVPVIPGNTRGGGGARGWLPCGTSPSSSSNVILISLAFLGFAAFLFRRSP